MFMTAQLFTSIALHGRVYLFLALTCLYTSQALQAQGQVSFEASTNANEVVLGSHFEVDFTLYNAQASQFKAPSFSDFEILSGPNQAISTSSFNGRWSRILTYSYTLQPKKIGKLTIGAASIRAEGKTWTSRPLHVQVVKGKNKQATTQAELERELRSNVFMQVIPSTLSPYIGQRVEVAYKIFTTQNIHRINQFNEPEYKGFYKFEVSNNSGEVKKEVIDGVQYTTKVIKDLALYPLKEGKLKLDPVTLNLSIVSPDQNIGRRRSIFSREKTLDIRVNSKPLSLNVQPFPPNAPPSFSGAVGKYTMDTRIGARQVTTNDAFSLRVHVRGDGDVKQIQTPDLMLGDSFEVFDVKVSVPEEIQDHRRNKNLPPSQKVFDFLITPKYAGKFKIQAQFSYLDPDSAAYVTLYSDPMGIVVKQGEKSTVAVEPKPTEDDKLKGLMTEWKSHHSRPLLFTSPIYWVLFFLPLLGLGYAFWRKEKEIRAANLDPKIVKQQKANEVASQRLQAAETFKSKQQSRAFYQEISNALLGYVSDKLDLPFSQMSKDNLKTKLQELHISDTLIQKAIKVLQTSELALFAGKDNAAAMEEIYTQAKEVLSGIEQEV